MKLSSFHLPYCSFLSLWFCLMFSLVRISRGVPLAGERHWLRTTKIYNKDTMRCQSLSGDNNDLTPTHTPPPFPSTIHHLPPDPQKTCPTEWHTFFYIHKDAIQPFLSLPVTVQSAPFGMVDYRVSLARCPVAEDEKCSTFVEEDYV